MQFKPELAQAILNGKKTQTRRPMKEHDYAFDVFNHLIPIDEMDDLGTIWSVYYGENPDRLRRRYMVGSKYTVQPGRGKKAIGRFDLLEIIQEDVRCISLTDALAESFTSALEFLIAWTEFYDSIAHKSITHQPVRSPKPMLLHDRPKNLYRAWVLRFELCEVIDGL